MRMKQSKARRQILRYFKPLIWFACLFCLIIFLFRRRSACPDISYHTLSVALCTQSLSGIQRDIFSSMSFVGGGFYMA